MKQPQNSNFERMRVEAERRRLAELEAQCQALNAELAAQAEAARRDRAELEEKSARLETALASQGDSAGKNISQLEARCEALAAELNERAEAERRQREDLTALNDALRSQAEAERANAAALEARCEALTVQLASQAEVDVAAQAKLDALQADLRSEAEASANKASALEERCEDLSAQIVQRVEAEQHHQAELEALNGSLAAQAETERETAASLEARCLALSDQLGVHAETDAEALAKLEALRADLQTQADQANAKAAALEEQATSLKDQLQSQAEADAEALARLETLREALSAEAESGRQKAAAIEAQVFSLADRVTEVDASFNDETRLRTAIAPVLSGALRDAGREDHDTLANAIAPYVVNTIRTEILNSEDELIEAIHPRLGVLIAAAITGAIEELNRKVDEALPIDRWMASVKGRLTGVSSAGFLIGDANPFVLKEAMLIERQSGLLLARECTLGVEDSDDAAPDEDLMAGMIAALQSFAEEAYGQNGAGELRRFSFTADTIYLRASPTKMLAVRCSGIAPPEIERQVDDLLVQALERVRGEESLSSAEVLRLSDFNAPPEPPTGGVSASTIMARGLGAIAATLLAIWGHGTLEVAHQQRWFDTVETVARSDLNLGPYPLSIARTNEGEGVRIAGLLPDEATKAGLEARIDWLASPLPVELDLAVVAQGARP